MYDPQYNHFYSDLPRQGATTPRTPVTDEKKGDQQADDSDNESDIPQVPPAHLEKVTP